MPYDEKLAARLRRILDRDVEEKRMFGGLTFMVGGHMCCGVTGSDLMVRLGEEAASAAIADPHARPMDFTGRPLKGFVFVAAEGIATDRGLRGWVRRALRFVETLPPKGPSRTGSAPPPGGPDEDHPDAPAQADRPGRPRPQETGPARLGGTRP